MKRMTKYLAIFGVDVRRARRSIKGMCLYLHDLKVLKKQAKSSVKEFPFKRPYPCIDDRFADSGSARGHYFHQDLLVARRIYENNPKLHVDVGSRIDGFVAHVATFREIEVIDIRPMSSRIKNIKFIQADMMKPVPGSLHEYADSLSCLHALEHFGLGRYGDPLNYDGYLLGLRNLCNILKPGGKLYLSVPIGPQRIEFNAHRVFSLGYLFECISKDYTVERLSYVDDDGELHEDVLIDDHDVANNYGCFYGCGIIEMTKHEYQL